ncbi:MAG: hypothetical protein IT429_22600, partial [Gemmataceae bacterium]|nr:hypothetical protein [Gemmataceae bacterium]
PFGQFGQAAATWYLKNSNSPGAPDYGPFAYGAAGWRPVVGDWDGLDAFLRTDGAAFARRAVPAALTRSGSLDLTSVQQNETASAGAALARSPAVAPKPRHSPGSREREAPDEAPERQAATLDAGAQSLAALDAVFAQLGS